MPATNHLPNMTNTPPGGWRYRVPETGQEFNGPSLDALIQQLLAHYRANGYVEPPDLPLKVESYVCNRVPEYCTGNEPIKTSFTAGLAHTFHVVFQGTRTLASWAGQRFEKVPIAQAEKRAAACATCAYNQEPEGCTACNIGALRDLTSKIAGNQSTPYDAQLKACKICSCQLVAKTRLPHRVLWPNMSEEQKQQLPAHCWLVTESPEAILRDLDAVLAVNQDLDARIDRETLGATKT